VTTYLHCYKTLRQEIKTFQHAKNEEQEENEGATTPMIPAPTTATTTAAASHDANNNKKKEDQEPVTTIIMNQFVHHVSSKELEQLIHHVDQNGYYGLELFLGYDAYTRYYQSITHVREIVAYYHRITLPNRHPPSQNNNINKNNNTTPTTVVASLPPQLPIDKINILWDMISHHAVSKSIVDRGWTLFMGYVMIQTSSSSI
jgi:hypothetical protein